MKIAKRLKQMVWITVLSCLMGMPAMAGENTENQKDWNFQLAPFYLWAWTMDGDITVGSRNQSVKIDLADLTDQLNSAFVANFQGMYKQKWGFFLDYNYIKFSEDGTQGPITADVDLKMQLIELDGLYRMELAPGHSLDFKAGVRYMDLDPTVKVTLVNTREKDDNQEWFDPVFGVRWLWDFADRWQLFVLGDIGGFGAGSEFTWQAAAAIDYKPFKYVSFRGGYRAIYVDYEDGTANTPDYFNFDATLHGPMLGLVIHW